MSEDRLQELENKLGILNKIVQLGWALIVGAFTLGAWVTLLEIRTQAASVQIERLARDMDASEKLVTHDDKRITRLEDTTVDIKKALDRIESKLQTR